MTRHLFVAKLIRLAIDTNILKGVEVDFKERRKRALEVIGKFRSDKRDIRVCAVFGIKTVFVFDSQFAEQGFKCIP